MSAGQAPVPLAEGVKCPACPDGHFVQTLKTRVDLLGNERQSVTFRCSHFHWGAISPSYNPDSLALGDHQYWAVVDGRVRVSGQGGSG